MGWNYRVVKKYYKCDCLHDGTSYFGIHEVWYNEDGEIDGWVEETYPPYGHEELKEIRGDFDLMMKAFDKPVLIEKDGTLVGGE